MLAYVYPLPFSMFGATSSVFLSPYSPFSNGGNNKGSTGEESGIKEAPEETSTMNYINDPLAISLSYPRRLVKV